MHIRLWGWNVASLLALCDVVLAMSSEPAIEPYSASCFGMLSQLYNWTACDLDASTSCFCDDASFKQTLVTCVDMLMRNASEGDGAGLQQKSVQWITATCPSVTLKELEIYASAVGQLEPLGCVSDKHTKCHAYRAFRPADLEVYHAFHAYTWNKIRCYQVCWHYGAILLSYWGLVCLIRALGYIGLKWYPKFFQQGIAKFSLTSSIRRYLTLPPLLTKYHSQPFVLLKYLTLNIPTREQSVIVIVFLGLCLGLTFGYDMYTPNYVWNYNDTETYCYYIGRITGYLMLFLLPLMIVFAGRNNFLIGLTGWTQDTFVVFHKWIGRIIVIELIIHTVVYTVLRFEQSRYKSMWSESYWNWGVVALVAGLLIVVQAMHMFRKLGYETFLVIHILSAILFIIGSYYHVYFLDGRLQFTWATVGVWGFERFVRMTRIIRSNPFATALIESHEGSVLEYTIFFSNEWKFEAGQYIYIHVLRPSWFWESHPFSVVAPIRESEKGALKLYVRAKDGATRKVLQRAIAAGGAFSAYVWVDGPYGHSYNVESFSEVVFIAGGLGITVVFAYIQKLVALQSSARMSLYWALSTEDGLSWFQEQIQYMETHGVNVHVAIKTPSSAGTPFSSSTGSVTEVSSVIPIGLENSSECDREKENLIFNPASQSHSTSKSPYVFYERLPVTDIVGRHISQSRGSIALLSCGPGGMNDDVRGAVVANLTTTDNFVEYIEESYSW